MGTRVRSLRSRNAFRRGPHSDPLSYSCHSQIGLIEIRIIHFNAAISAARQQWSSAGTGAACKRIEYHIARQRIVADNRYQRHNGLLRWVELIAGREEPLHIRQRHSYLRRATLCQQIGMFMLILEELRYLRRIRLAKDQMPYRAKPGFPPCFQKLFGARPAIKAE